jgi:hypothetical protein
MTSTSFILSLFASITGSKIAIFVHIVYFCIRPSPTPAKYQYFNLHQNSWCAVHPTTYGPPQSKGLSGRTGFFQSTTWEPRDLPLGEIGSGQLVHALSRCSPLKEGRGLWEHTNFRDAHFGITYRLRPTRRWRNTIIHAGGNVKVIFFLSFFLCIKIASVAIVI